jgi:hypothetical protein
MIVLLGLSQWRYRRTLPQRPKAAPAADAPASADAESAAD